MSEFLTIHPENPQLRLINQAVKILQKGGLIVYPTDAGYALGCALNEKTALDRLIKWRKMDTKQHLTLMCADLSEMGRYAQMDNAQYRRIKAVVPDSYTFILLANKIVPNRVVHAKRKTLGFRMPNHPIALALIQEMGEPIVSCTLMLPEENRVLSDMDDIRERLSRHVDLIIDGGWYGDEPSTVVDMVGDVIVLRQGKADMVRFG